MVASMEKENTKIKMSRQEGVFGLMGNVNNGSMTDP